ncbi:hypothetical protein TWF102_008088 [Orbilia oligospora]|uniref:Uncharacterized protein n=1 Tax=Orbilia oligospora TaxID=2813651 RepID=A0A7C8JCB6_ORBOL|nr:hypothetical protein TWF706_009824 [Orbilia oligospora]KAF3110511.1 hypothetical protein TWF102_008088 [Orbilia oligospora]
MATDQKIIIDQLKNVTIGENMMINKEAPITESILLTLKRGLDGSWDSPGIFCFRVATKEGPPTIPIEIAKTMTRIPGQLCKALLEKVDTANKKRRGSLIWKIGDLWTWSKKGHESNIDVPIEHLLEIVAHLVLSEKDQDEFEGGLEDEEFYI